MAMKLVRYPDLKAQGIVNNRMTLRRWMNLPDDPFPAALALGANTVAWKADEVEGWLLRRVDRKAIPSKYRGTPKKKIVKPLAWPTILNPAKKSA